MAKKQLKKVNQPKKYLQGGSNMNSVSMMRQTPYYLGQVERNAAEETLEETRKQALDTRQTAVQAKADAEAQQKAEMNQAVQQGAGTVGQGLVADKKAGNLGKFFIKNPLSGQAAINISAGTQVAPMYVAPATTTIASNVGSLAPGAVEVGANLANTSTNVVSGVNAASAGVPAIAAPTGEAVTQGIASGAGKTAAGGLSAGAAAGIGIAANIGGMIIKNRSNDKSAYTFTDKERRGNVGGSMLSSAGTGFGIGNMLLPGVGGVIGAGIGAGIGALKARKENKAAEEEAKRLQQEQMAIAGANQSARINSMKTGVDTGFGLNSSANMNNQFTSAYQVAKLGGVKYIPGGKIVPIEGTDAVEYIGKSHAEGGMFPEAKKQGGKINKGNIEVEDGETEDQVIMNDNSKKDYIFSKYLKLGGKSFAQRHKEILKGSGSQAEIQRLATMQEEKAGRNPQQVAMYGGIHKYVDGGVTEPCQNGYVKDANGNCVPQQPYQQVGVFNKENPGEPTKEMLEGAVPERRGGPYGSIINGYRLKDGTFYDPNHMTEKIMSVKNEGDQINANLFALPGAIMSGAASGLAGATRLGYNMVNDKALGTGNSGSAGALPPNNTQAVGNYGGNVFAAKPVGTPNEPFNVFGNYPAMIKQAAALSASGGQPQSQGGSNNYTGPTGKGEGQQYFNNVGQGQGQSDPYNTAENAKKMGWGDDVEGYIKSEFGFGPNYKAPAAPSKGSGSGSKKKAAPVYDREAWRKKGVGMMTDEELTAEGLGPQDSIPKDAQYRKPPVAAAGSTGYITPAGVAGSAPNAKTGPVSAAGQTIVNGTAPSNTTAGTQSAVSSIANIGTPAIRNLTQTGTTGTKATGQNPAVTGQNNPAATSNVQGGVGATTTNDKLIGSKTSGYLPTFENAKTNPLWTKDNYGKWKADVGTSMDDPATAQKVADYLINYKGDYSAEVQKRIKGKTGQDLYNTIEKLATDNKPGIFHEAVRQALDASKTTGNTGTGPVPPPVVPEKPGETPTETVKKKEPCGPGTYLSSDGSCQPVPAFKQGTRINGSLVAGLGQLVPIGAALMNPYKIAPGIVGAPGIKGPLMQRNNMNQDRAAAIQQNVAYKNAVLGQNAGPASLVAMQSANTKTNQQMMQIAKQEQDINRQLASQEASLAMDASKFNADTDQKRQMFNTEFNQKERQYRREDILGALDAGASRIAGIVKDERSYKANERLARALDETHSYDRFSIYEQLTKQAKQKNSPYNGVSDAELRRMAAGISEQIYGEMGVVAEAPATTTTTTTQTARTGGVRQYVSRLGELKSARATKAKL